MHQKIILKSFTQFIFRFIYHDKETDKIIRYEYMYDQNKYRSLMERNIVLINEVYHFKHCGRFGLDEGFNIFDRTIDL